MLWAASSGNLAKTEQLSFISFGVKPLAKAQSLILTVFRVARYYDKPSESELPHFI